MIHVTKEADRLRSALLRTPEGDTYDCLYAAQQALAWALDPTGFKSPFDLVTGTGSGDCSERNRPPQSLDTFAAHE